MSLLHNTGELREFIHEEHAIVGEADFTRFGGAAAADDGCHGGGVVWFAKRAMARDTAGFDQAG